MNQITSLLTGRCLTGNKTPSFAIYQQKQHFLWLLCVVMLILTGRIHEGRCSKVSHDYTGVTGTCQQTGNKCPHRRRCRNRCGSGQQRVIRNGGGGVWGSLVAGLGMTAVRLKRRRRLFCLKNPIWVPFMQIVSTCGHCLLFVVWAVLKQPVSLV